MIDTLLRFRGKAAQSTALEQLCLQPGKYAVVTLHRPSNVDDSNQLGQLLAVLNRIGQHLPVVFPVHPRTAERISNISTSVDNIRFTPPQSYLDFLRLTSAARMVLTDSGGIQEETTILQVPCLTLRENTERPVTITEGTNQLVGTAPKRIEEAALEVLARPTPTDRIPKYWDGSAAARTLDVIERVV
jgi:UDP-N-acetylglucosamine 2-epimerase (non-hydrolysing)